MYQEMSASYVKIDECIEEFAPRTQGYQMEVLGRSRGFSDVLGGSRGYLGGPPPYRTPSEKEQRTSHADEPRWGRRILNTFVATLLAPRWTAQGLAPGLGPGLGPGS